MTSRIEYDDYDDLAIPVIEFDINKDEDDVEEKKS
jgi:hypothetical protein